MLFQLVSAAARAGRSRPACCLKAAQADQPKPESPGFSTIPNKNEHGTAKDGKGKQVVCVECFLHFSWAISSSLSTSEQP